MSSSDEFSDLSTEGYLSDDSECLDFQEIETAERVKQEPLSESDLQAYMDEPLADEKWLKNNRQQEVLKKQLADETRTGDW